MRLKLVASLIATFVMSIPAFATDSLRIADAGGDPGATGVPVAVMGTSDAAYQGLSLAISYESTRLDCTGISFAGTAIEAVTGTDPEYAVVSIDDAAGTIIAGIIFDLDPASEASVAASPTVEVHLCDLMFDVTPEEIPTDADIMFTDGIGTPAIDNFYSVGGFSVFPTLTDGVFSITNNYHMYLPDLTLFPGQSTTLICEADHPEDMNGFQVCATWNNSEITLNQPASDFDYLSGLEGVLLLTPSGSAVEFYVSLYVAEVTPGYDWVVVSVSYDFVPPFDGQLVPAGTGHGIVQFDITISPSLMPDQVTQFQLVNGLGPAPDQTFDNFLIVLGGQSVLAQLSGGTLTMGSAASGFRRGDANGDGVCNIADAIFLINYIFVVGALPTCFDAGDANDDGVLNVADIIFIINYNFTSGATPPSPGPFNCGPDPTSDPLDCAVYIPSC